MTAALKGLRLPSAERRRLAVFCDLLAFKQSILKIDGTTLEAKLCGSPDWKRLQFDSLLANHLRLAQTTPALLEPSFSILFSTGKGRLVKGDRWMRIFGPASLNTAWSTSNSLSSSNNNKLKG